MNLLYSFKCIYCLIKCSKYLYYIKKAICLVALLVGAVTLVGFLRSDMGVMKKMKEML